jgi:hypothetical protein
MQQIIRPFYVPSFNFKQILFSLRGAQVSAHRSRWLEAPLLVTGTGSIVHLAHKSSMLFKRLREVLMFQFACHESHVSKSV